MPLKIEFYWELKEGETCNKCGRQIKTTRIKEEWVYLDYEYINMPLCKACWMIVFCTEENIGIIWATFTNYHNIRYEWEDDELLAELVDAITGEDTRSNTEL